MSDGMSGLIEAIQKSFADNALKEAMWCHDNLHRFTGRVWKKHYEAVMYYNLFKWAGYRE